MQLVVGLIALVAAFALYRLLRPRKAIIHHGHVGLLYREGSFVRDIGPGVLRWFDPLKKTELVQISVLPSASMATALEVISRDQFAFRVTVAPLTTIVDPRAFHENTPLVSAETTYFPGFATRYELLHTALAAAVLAEVARHTLEEFLVGPAAALDPVKDKLAHALPGSRLNGLAITAVTLPPEIRKMFTEVERARREGLASLERARAEQASLRALANAARTLAGNPQLAQLRQLQTMENARGAKTFILGDSAGMIDSKAGS